jgi:phosphatidylserine/phosphatidylglycerophosphate/cardiolipin synthase-like enzyme
VLGNLHVKSLVVDGRYAIVMGANPEKVHNADEPWFDTGYRFEGEVADALRADFAGAWARSKHWVCSGARTTDCERDNLPLEPLEEDAAVRPVFGCRAVLVASRKASRNPLRNKADNPADQAFLALFRNAEKVIRVQTPNLNDDAAKKALLDAMIRRGVEVNLILSKGFNEPAVNLPGQGGDNRKNVERLYKALREAGVADPCARLKARWYSFDGMTPVVGNGPRASHAKYTSADDALVVVGTSNMDTQSWNFSREVNIVVDDPQIALAWDRQVFIANFNRAIPVDECRQGSQAEAQQSGR